MTRNRPLDVQVVSPHYPHALGKGDEGGLNMLVSGSKSGRVWTFNAGEMPDDTAIRSFAMIPKTITGGNINGI